MATKFLGFNVYACDASTGENIQFIRNIVLTIATTNTTSYSTQQSIPASTVISSLDSITSERNAISDAVVYDITKTTLTDLQSIMAGTVGLSKDDLSPYAGCKLKLYNNSSGYYGISGFTIGSGGDLPGSQFKLYDNNDVYKADVYFPFGLINLCGFFGIKDYDGGTLVPNLNNRIYPIYVTWRSGNSYNLYSNTSLQAALLTSGVCDWFNAVQPDSPTPPTTDPYGAGGGTTGDDETEGTGGEGDFDDTSDPIDLPRNPTLEAVNTGFISLYMPSESQLQALASYMWSNPLFDPSAWKKIFADPMDAILGLSIIPLPYDPPSSSVTVKIGNISTDVTMPRLSGQHYYRSFGSITVNEFWGGYLDYAPYTKAEIYLPYIGTHPIDIDDIMGKTIEVEYHFDLLSGACSALIKCGDSVLYTFLGQMSASIPITGNDWTNVINGVITAGTAIGSMAATGGMTAPMAVPQLAQTAVNNLKPSIEKSGGLTGAGAQQTIQYPYLILTRPRQAVPSNQNAFTGYPSFITRTLSSLSGYTEMEIVHLENVHATDAELTEIESLLKSGVIF